MTRRPLRPADYLIDRYQQAQGRLDEAEEAAATEDPPEECRCRACAAKLQTVALFCDLCEDLGCSDTQANCGDGA